MQNVHDHIVMVASDTSRAAGLHPFLARVDGVTAATAVDLSPQEPAAEDAELISVAVDGDELYAIGRRFGGAHSNPRLTMWDGTASSNKLTSRPQEFWTFGGHDAGNPLGITALSGRGVIFGLGSGAAGIEGPAPAVDVAADGAITPGEPTVLAGTPPSGPDPNALVTLVAGRPLVLTGAGTPSLQLGCPNGWRTLAAPPGTATVLQSAASGLYAITSAGVQRLDPPRC